MFWTGSPLLMFLLTLFPPAPSKFFGVVKKKKYPIFCSLMDVRMDNCYIVIFAFCCLFAVIFFCTINHLFSLWPVAPLVSWVFFFSKWSFWWTLCSRRKQWSNICTNSLLTRLKPTLPGDYTRITEKSLEIDQESFIHIHGYSILIKYLFAFSHLSKPML